MVRKTQEKSPYFLLSPLGFRFAPEPHEGKVILCTHLGEPKSFEGAETKSFEGGKQNHFGEGKQIIWGQNHYASMSMRGSNTEQRSAKMAKDGGEVTSSSSFPLKVSSFPLH